MKIVRAYLHLQNGETQDYHVKARQEQQGAVTAVYLDGFSKELLNPEFGAGIGLEIEGVQSWMADFRHSEYWCRPEFGTAMEVIPDETQGLIYRMNNGQFGVILPVVSEKYKCVLCGQTEPVEKESAGNPERNEVSELSTGEKRVTESLPVIAKLFSWYEKLNSCHALAFVWAEGENPYALLEQCTETALKLLGTGYRTRPQRRYPEIFEYLGWCSWDAMEIRVSESLLMEKCEEFKEKQIPVRWVILDDMWAHVKDFYGVSYSDRTEMFRLMHSSKLYSFEADPIRFPNGLEHCIAQINEYGIKVGMWHPTTGYWMGEDPEGPIVKEHGDLLIQAESGQYVHSPQKEKAYLFYDAFHEYLRRAGAEFVKIDNQSMIRRFYKGLAPVGTLARDIHDAMEASVGQHFDNTMINCMGMASEDMWNRSVSPVSRCSDDFLPEDSAWFTKHILQCSYNSMIQGQFYYCDWDMWWTDDGQAVKNSVLRAISGGPIYVSDQIGRSRREILMPLILEDGRILRCDRPAMPTRDCITVDPIHSGKPFKLQNLCGESGVMAVFNLDEADDCVTGSICPEEIDGLEGETFAIYEYFSGEMKIVSRDETLPLILRNRQEFRLYTIAPVKDGFAAIGRIDKFIAPKTIRSIHGREVELWEPGDYAVVEDGNLLIKTC